MSFGSSTPAASATSYDVRGTILGGYCRGPLHTLTKVEVGNDIVWEGTLLRSASTNPVEFTVPGRGTIELYWGTEDQAISSWLAGQAFGKGHTHPPYKGVCFAVPRWFLFGRDTYTAPTVRLAGLREPVQSLITGPATALVDGQANPWVALAELFTDPLSGLGHPLSIFDAPSWQACADALIPRAPEVYVSLRLGDATSARARAATLLALCQGYVRPQRGTGKLEAGMWPQPETIDTASLPILNSRLLMDEIESDPETWEDVKLRTIVSFKNRENLYKDDVRTYNDPRAGRHSTSRSPLKLELPIVRPEQAATLARLHGRLYALPGAKYSVAYRGPALPDLQPGSHVMLDVDAVPGGTELRRACRVLSVNREFNSRTHTAELEAERTLAPVAYTPAEEPGTPSDAEIPAIANARLFELSPQAADGEDGAVALLAQRPGAVVTELLIYYDSIASTGALYPFLSRSRNYALRGTLHTTIDTDDTSLVVDLAGTLDRELAATSPGSVAARNDTLLLILVGPLDTTGGTYNRPVEILSIRDIAASGTDQLTLATFRARLGTAALAASAGAEVWIAPRAGLPWFRHADFEARIDSGETCYFKLQPGTSLRARPLDEITPVEFRFNTTRAFAPVITPTAPPNDSGQDYASCDLLAEVLFTGSVTDADANLDAIAIVLVVAGAEQVLFSRTYGGVSSATYAAKYTFETAGIYPVIIRATDTSGRTTEHAHTIQCAVTSGTRCAEPSFEENDETIQYVAGSPWEAIFDWYHVYTATLRCATMASEGGSSSTVRIQEATCPIGTPVDAITWNDRTVNASADVAAGESSGQVADSPVHTGYDVRIWARAIDTTGTLTPSYPVYRDFVH